MSEIVLDVTGMTCAACSSRVERKLARTQGISRAGVDLLQGLAVVSLEDGCSAEVALEAVRAAGYGAILRNAGDTTKQASQHRAQVRNQLLASLTCLGAGAISMVAMAFHPMGHHAGPLDWAIFLAAVLAVAWPGRTVPIQAWSELRSRALGMHTLAALGIASALSLSAAAILFPQFLRDHGFPAGSHAESVLFLLGFLLLGRWLEAKVKDHSRQALSELSRFQAQVAHRLIDGNEIDCAPELLLPGDRLRIRPGERIPADGKVCSGRSTADLSLVTGESDPIVLAMGVDVPAGTLNGTGSVEIEVTRRGVDSTLTELARMVQFAQGSRPHLQAFAERFVRRFVPAVLAFAALSALGWIFLPASPRWSDAVFAMVAILVAACPCALGLAIPAVASAAAARGAKEGLLLREPGILDSLAKVDVVLLDKTGTLTQGRPELVEILPLSGWSETTLLAMATAVERDSEHPLAGAILRAAGTRKVIPPEAQEFEAVPGWGAQAMVQGQKVRIGRPDWIFPGGALPDAASAFLGRTGSILALEVDGTPVALLELRDPLRSTAVQAVAALHARGVRVELLTGDAPEPAMEAARACGIEVVQSRILPQGKLERVKTLQSQGHCVAFVGDGLNDAPALAAADAGLAVGSGTATAMGAARLTLVGGDPQLVVRALELGRQSRRYFLGNLAWAFGYNALLLPVAAGILSPWGLRLSPGLSALAMSLSSVSVLLHSLSLLRARLGPSGN
ncbi:MAG: hypothetical protein RL318_250 [Fibrobacterota bacterium]|jgi:Cu+-exporting ATPase